MRLVEPWLAGTVGLPLVAYGALYRPGPRAPGPGRGWMTLVRRVSDGKHKELCMTDTVSLCLFRLVSVV